MSKIDPGLKAPFVGLREQIVENQQTIDQPNRDLAQKSNEADIQQTPRDHVHSISTRFSIALRAMERVLGRH
jgi:hypothetical protein